MIDFTISEGENMVTVLRLEGEVGVTKHII